MSGDDRVPRHSAEHSPAGSKLVRTRAPNPKDLIGAKKVDVSLFPAVALLHGAHAMMDGAAKYGPYNWRDYAVEARTYVAAAKRHLDGWLEGEELAADSGVHHLGHAMACCAILLDAIAHAKLIDNRPAIKGAFAGVLAELNDKVKAKSQNPSPVAERRNASIWCGFAGRQCHGTNDDACKCGGGALA